MRHLVLKASFVNMATIFFILAACILGQLHLASSSTQFNVRLEHYENYENLLQIHERCDSGRPCDPAFLIRVTGSWGQRDFASDCMSNVNQITFGSTIGTNLTNLISIMEPAAPHPVLIEASVKECNFDQIAANIGEFHAQLTQLPRPFLFTDRVDFGDTERVLAVDMTPSQNTPLSIKLRVAVWRQCQQFYYGQDCSKFCRPVPGHSCHPETGEMLVCAGSVCTKWTPSSAGRTRPSETPTGPSQPVPAPSIEKISEPSNSAGVQTDVGKQTSQASSLTLVVALSCLLALTTVAAAAILIVVRRCGQPKNRRRISNRALIPPTHSMAVGVRDPEVGSDSTAPLQQDFPNLCYSVQTRPLPPPGGFVQAPITDASQRPDSDEYETPEDPPLPPPGESMPPPLPARDNIQAQCQRTALSRSFSKPNK